jgi:glycosyltransferase involved in cell wall biosynthesis
MKISLITAVYNRHETIAQAMCSVAEQTYVDREHIIIDGGSDDGTLTIIKRCASADVQWVSERDEGIYDALNKGIRISQGEVVGIVHSDDFLAHPHVLERIMEAFANPTVDAVYGDLDYITAGSQARRIRRWRGGTFRPERLAWGWMPPHPALFVRRRVIECYGAYDPTYRIAADYDAILRWFGHGQISSVYIPEVVMKMRLGGESNRSLGRIWRKSREDYRALRRNQIGGLATLAAKNLRKLPQFFG